MRSPLNQIDGLVTLINFEANRLSEQQKVSLSKITNTTAHSKELLSKILSSKTLDPSQLSLDLKVIGVNPIIQSLASDYTIIAREKNIDIELEMPAETLNVNIDKNYFEQVIENLISNAIKFSPTDKKVSVRLLKINSSIRVEIEDEGPGVNKNDMNKLFGKYQRLSAQPTGGETSTGLGLSIVKKYVQAMNGKVWCESEEGQGAKFIVEFNKA
jgi:signal transduction histidine kinase